MIGMMGAGKTAVGQALARNLGVPFVDSDEEIVRAADRSIAGGAFLAEANRALLHDFGVSVWLRVDLDLLWQRVRHKTTRPLLRTPNPRETLRRLYEARLPFYQLADMTVESAPELSVEDMAQRVVLALAGRVDVLEGE